MRKHHYIVAMLGLLLAFKANAQPENPDWKSIEPGKRVGPVKLGMSKADVIAALPVHYGTRSHTFGIEELIFRHKSGLHGWDVFTDVLFKDGKAIQIVSSNEDYKISGGFSKMTNMETIKYNFPGLVTANYFFSTSPGATGVRVYDNAQQGIIFGTGSNPKVEYLVNMQFPDFVGVHSPGRAFIAIKEGVRGTQNAPPPPKPKLIYKVVFNPKQKKAAQSALNAIRRLETAVNVGTVYADYSRRLVDTQIAVNEGLYAVPSSDFKKEVMAAMTSYKLASSAWSLSIQSSDSELMAGIMERMRQTHWVNAAAHIRNAENLLR